MSFDKATLDARLRALREKQAGKAAPKASIEAVPRVDNGQVVFMNDPLLEYWLSRGLLDWRKRPQTKEELESLTREWVNGNGVKK